MPWKSRFIVRPIDLYLLRNAEADIEAPLGKPLAGHRILDIGCGNGAKTESFRRMGWDAVGVDISQSAIGEARRQFPESRFQTASVESLPFNDGSFEAVFSCSTLQYVDHRIAIAEVARVLKPSGFAVLIENLEGSPLARVYRMLYQLKGYPPHLKPRRHLEFSEIETLFREFVEVRVRTFNLLTTALHSAGMIHQILAKREHVAFAPLRLHSLTSAMDAFAIRKLPKLSKWCWTACIVARKPD
jgi:ubiquinone/menaquinone biosynthesis C-methylase UbiE